MSARNKKKSENQKSWFQRNQPKSKVCLLNLSEKFSSILEIENHIMETPKN